MQALRIVDILFFFFAQFSFFIPLIACCIPQTMHYRLNCYECTVGVVITVVHFSCIESICMEMEQHQFLHDGWNIQLDLYIKLSKLGQTKSVFVKCSKHPLVVTRTIFSIFLWSYGLPPNPEIRRWVPLVGCISCC